MHAKSGLLVCSASTNNYHHNSELATLTNANIAVVNFLK